jgi:hypothetical protein
MTQLHMSQLLSLFALHNVCSYPAQHVPSVLLPSDRCHVNLARCIQYFEFLGFAMMLQTMKTSHIMSFRLLK